MVERCENTKNTKMINIKYDDKKSPKVRTKNTTNSVFVCEVRADADAYPVHTRFTGFFLCFHIFLTPYCVCNS